MTVDTRALELWGKADRRRARAALGPSWHPLIAHMLDVAACAERLLVDAQPRRLAAFAERLDTTADVALRLVLFFVALHDLGKATPAFQRKVDERYAKLQSLGFDFPENDEPHGAMSAVLVTDALRARAFPCRFALGIARAVGAHHGEFPALEHLNDIFDAQAPRGRADAWSSSRAAIVDALASIVGEVPSCVRPRSAPDANALLADLAGLTAVADWLGSNADVFAYTGRFDEPAAYWDIARERAHKCVRDAGLRATSRAQARTFEQLFGRAPWPLHDAMARALDAAAPGSLVIVEAPMGEGKTEAALYAYDALLAKGADGLFFALPTQATANQILGRVERFLASAHPGTPGLHLVHGGAALSEHYDDLKRRALRLRSINGPATDADEGPQADAWFVRNKRALLVATHGVGTVDQALLGVLRAKHHFLRLHGLGRKVFVVDEVHAYDTFTSEILARLCEWLFALGATVVLLSATLSSPQRKRLLRARGANAGGEVAAYPRITIATDSSVRTVPFAARRPSFEVELSWHGDDALPREVGDAIAGGGCVAWIVNTVRRAQETYLRLRDLQRSGALRADVQLLHARFPHRERQARERGAESAFGPPGQSVQRPWAAILVGTQVLEQSLDLDFDLMITELAPVDLVLQRAGRLHRHDRTRPVALAARQLWLITPEGAERAEGPTFGATRFVYDEAILMRSHAAVRDRRRVSLPDDIEPLVELVYAGPAPSGLTPPERERLLAAERARATNEGTASSLAEVKMLPSPAESDPFRSFECRFDEEDPAIHEALRAVTRLGDPSVTVVPVVGSGSRLALASRREVSFDEGDIQLPLDTVRAIAREAIVISSRRLVPALFADHPKAFERSGHLRHHRLLRLGEDGSAVVGGIDVKLDAALGLVIGGRED